MHCTQTIISCMKNNTMSSINPPHIAIFPNAGMGHYTPFLRLVSTLLSRNCILTLITPKTTVSSAESTRISFFLATHPQVRHLVLDTLPPDPSIPSHADPFWVHYDAVSRSAHLVLPLLSSVSPPVSAVICDLLVAKGAAAVCKELGVPFYTFITTSAKFFSSELLLLMLVSRPDHKINKSCDMVEIPGLAPFPLSSVPLHFLKPNYIFGAITVENIKVINEAKGVLINTFEWLEQETLDALNSGRVLSNLPPVYAVGPLKRYALEEDRTQCLQWLEQQPTKSVIYVSFGSRTAMSIDQIRELRNGLERSGCRFLWVLKTSKVDKEDKEDVRSLLGDSFLERTKHVGLVVKGFVNQQEVLAHKAIAGFMSHCGWNSLGEAAERGVPVLAWPRHGDQRTNAEVVEKAGLGIWERNWGFESEGLVKEEEIAKKIVELMENETIRARAEMIGEEAQKAREIGGSAEKAITSVIAELGR